MDIRSWLDDTVLPEQPASPGFPDRQAKEALAVPAAALREGREKRRRRHSTSDSSLLRPALARRDDPSIHVAVDSQNESACGDHGPLSDHVSSSGCSSQQFARRARRKTRPERYDPAAKRADEQGAAPRRFRNGESSKTKRRARRKGADGPHAVVQSFRAKNVGKDRLTLKPREKLGLFNRGKASSPVKGRGLPDLVFSEMNFLQKRKEPSEETVEAEPQKKMRKRDQASARQEEISAYFTSARPALADKDGNARSEKPGRAKTNTHKRDTRDPSSPPDRALPTTEPIGRSKYLGFGSRGPQHESESYVSWSESVRVPSVAQAAPLHKNHDQLIYGHETKCSDQQVLAEISRRSTDFMNTDDRSWDVSNGCFALSPLSASDRKVTRASSLPQQCVSPRKSGSLGDQRRRHSSDAISSAPMPRETRERCIGNILGADTGLDSDRALHHTTVLSEHTGNHETQPAPTRPRTRKDSETVRPSRLGSGVQECNAAFHKRRRRSISEKVQQGAKEDQLDQPHRWMASQGSFIGPLRHFPTVRFVGAGAIQVNPRYTMANEYEMPVYRSEQGGRPRREETLLLGDEYVDDVQGTAFEDDDDVDFVDPEREPEGNNALEFDEDLDTNPNDGEQNQRDYRRREAEGDSIVGTRFWRPNRLY